MLVLEVGGEGGARAARGCAEVPGPGVVRSAAGDRGPLCILLLTSG